MEYKKRARRVGTRANLLASLATSATQIRYAKWDGNVPEIYSDPLREKPDFQGSSHVKFLVAEIRAGTFSISVSKVVLNIKDEAKGEALLTLLRQMNFIEISEANQQKKPSISGFLKASGIWKKRDISVSSLRQQAWRK